MKRYITLLFLSVFSLCSIHAQNKGGVVLPGDELKTIDSTKAVSTDSLIAPATDSATAAKKKEPKPPYVHQFRIGVDVARLATNFIYPDKKGYEMQFDYLLRGKNYVVFETGFGKNIIEYTNLQYNNNGAFVKIGYDKNVIDIVNDHDYDIFFIGIRYGMGFGKRDSATFLVPSYFGPPSEGGSPAQNYFIHWGELTLGLRVEIFKQVFVGWNARIKFLFNSGAFQELAPNYVPGYGQGDKSTVAGGNFYISYGIRWGGK